MLFQAYTACKPVEIVDGTKARGSKDPLLDNISADEDSLATATAESSWDSFEQTNPLTDNNHIGRRLKAIMGQIQSLQIEYSSIGRKLKSTRAASWSQGLISLEAEGIVWGSNRSNYWYTGLARQTQDGATTENATGKSG